MTQNDINRAKDAISARAAYGSNTAGGDKTETAIEAYSDYIRTSLDPKCGWDAALKEIERLKRELEECEKRDDETASIIEDHNRALDTIDRLMP